MDYSTYFSATSQAIPFFGLPPTPTYVEEGKLDTSVDPVDAAFFPPYDAYRYSHLTQHQPTSYPPQSDQSPILAPAAPAAPSPSGPDDASPSAIPGGMGLSGVMDGAMNIDGVGGTSQNDPSELGLGRTRSSSEEKDALTPAQSRRKAQNRAAQRAFRERKERHVRDLEAKLSALESSATSLATDNERLKLALQRATTENEILRATTSSGHRLSIDRGQDDTNGSGKLHQLASGSAGMGAATSRVSAAEEGSSGLTSGARALLAGAGELSESTNDQLLGATAGTSAIGDVGEGLLLSDSTSSQNLAARTSSNGAARASARSRNSAFLPAAATWDLIQAHPLVKQGVVDIADVCEALRATARCDGQGPVFREESVWKAVEGARRGGGDELI